MKLLSAGNKFDPSRNPKQTFRAVTITEIGALLPLPHIFCGWIYACIWRVGNKFQALLVAGAGKKNFWTAAQSASVRMGCCSQSHFGVTWQQYRVTDSRVRPSAEMVCCLSEVRTPFRSTGSNSLSPQPCCGQGDASLLLSLGAWKALGVQWLQGMERGCLLVNSPFNVNGHHFTSAV